MLFLHEAHKVKGACELDFEHAIRDGWTHLLARNDDARLLWYFHHAHGSGVSYRFVTITAIKDFDAWERIALRIQDGDLGDWMGQVDQYRYQLDCRLLAPLEWSPLQEVDFSGVPLEPKSHCLDMYIEDTVQASDTFGSFLSDAHALYERGSNAQPRIATLTAAFQPVVGAGPRSELLLLHKLDDRRLLADFYLTGSGGDGPPWGALNRRAELGDNWHTRVLRIARWSPFN